MFYASFHSMPAYHWGMHMHVFIDSGGGYKKDIGSSAGRYPARYYNAMTLMYAL